ncbi:MAG TPA: phosphodiester glycosidase family protein [Candidatus Polarisedimenticolia bacterium]|nr:phosphodiester glycosidase family protein [Candidatus Polarisedimenticolia bacterium]
MSLILAASLAAAAGSPWSSPAPGLELRMMDGGSACRKGSPVVAVVRADPARWRMDLFHETEPIAGGSRHDVEGWQKRIEAPVVFNAGQYYPGREPMGLFVKGGRNLGTRQLPAWKGLLAGEPRPRHSVPRMAILDLEHDRFELEETPYRVVMQSFMLLDRGGRKRVRRSDWHANRTAVAVDDRGRLLVLHTEGAWTLWEMADWLARSDLRVRQALSMDGGFEAQLCVRAGGTRYASYGRWHVDDRGDHSVPGLKVRIPAVVALYPRR